MRKRVSVVLIVLSMLRIPIRGYEPPSTASCPACRSVTNPYKGLYERDGIVIKSSKRVVTNPYKGL